MHVMGLDYHTPYPQIHRPQQAFEPRDMFDKPDRVSPAECLLYSCALGTPNDEAHDDIPLWRCRLPTT